MKKAKQVTAALYDGDFAALSALSQFEMKSIFAGAKIHEMLYESGMTVLDVVLKAKIYKHDRMYLQPMYTLHIGKFNHLIISNLNICVSRFDR